MIAVETNYGGPAATGLAYGGSNRAAHIFASLQTVLVVWLLSYYLLPNTLLSRISPEGLAAEIAGVRREWIVGACAVVLFFAAIAIIVPKERAASRSKYPPIWLITVVFGVPLIGACFAAESGSGLEAFSVLSAMSVGMIAARIARERIVEAITAAASVQAVYAIIYHREQINQFLSGAVLRAGGTFNHPNHLYTLMIIALPFTFCGVLRAKSANEVLAYLIAASAELAALILSWSRGGAIAAGCGLLLTVVLSRAPRRIVLICGLGFVTVCCATCFVRSSGERNGVSVAGANSARLRQWEGGLSIFISHPLLGVGAGKYSQQVITQHGSEIAVNVVEDPKNLLILWLAERGLTGGILFILFSCAIVSAVRKAMPSIYAIGVAAAWTSLLVAGMVDTPFGPASRYVGNCCFGLLIGATALLNTSDGRAYTSAVALQQATATQGEA